MIALNGMAMAGQRVRGSEGQSILMVPVLLARSEKDHVMYHRIFFSDLFQLF